MSFDICLGMAGGGEAGGVAAFCDVFVVLGLGTCGESGVQ